MNNIIIENVKKTKVVWLPTQNLKNIVGCQRVLASWKSQDFKFIEEDTSFGKVGLRLPQIGALYSLLGYLKSDNNMPATIVMPTGTGKTEVILSSIIAGKFEKTLVIVPSDALREQTSDKLLKCGLLRELGLISEKFLNPIVAIVKHGLSAEDIQPILKANVIIATASAISKVSSIVLKKISESCSHLIIDEAHHVNAVTWLAIKRTFNDKPVLQFTATPFRTDTTRIEGKIIFNYPLSQAQKDGYFMPIEFHPIKEFQESKVDEAIAKKAITLLRNDIEIGLDHIMMARTNNIARAKKIIAIYERESDLNPILITSKEKDKKSILDNIRSGQHKIIVCVDMLGEGFDLPQLKIAAIHDPHKSINILLQFTGRFTRTTEKNIGHAKFIANIANPNMNESLMELYQENSDWNAIIEGISHNKISEEKRYQEFRSEFANKHKLLDLGLMPNVSTTIYKVDDEVQLENFNQFAKGKLKVTDYAINDSRNLLIFTTLTNMPVKWTTSKELHDAIWDLYIVFYCEEQKLLFVHTSSKDTFLKDLVRVLTKNSEQVTGDVIFRSLDSIKRLTLQNIGLNKNKRGLRYSMHTGTDINEQIPDIEAQRAVKSNIFGKGFEDGSATSLGCSYKGKIWAMESSTVYSWMNWCKNVGRKILDDTIDTNALLKSAMKSEILTKFPNLTVLSVDWSSSLLIKNEHRINFIFSGVIVNFINCELEVCRSQPKDDNKFCFMLISDNLSAKITISISNGKFIYICNQNISIEIGKNLFNLQDFFEKYPPLLFLSDTSYIENGYRYYLSEDYNYLFDKNSLQDWNWVGIDISVESQTREKITNSIQFHTIQEIKNDYDIIFDDDGSGEIADIIAIKKISDNDLIIHLYHCKYCSKSKGIAKPGARVEDVYQVAGQAQKSVKWLTANKIGLLFDRLIHRENQHVEKYSQSRLDKGTLEELVSFKNISRFADIKYGITIVQPAISKNMISEDQLLLLGSTSTYIEEVSGIQLGVIVSN